MDNFIPSTSQTNIECPMVVDTSDVLERIIRFRQLTSWDQVKDVINLLQKVCY